MTSERPHWPALAKDAAAAELTYEMRAADMTVPRLKLSWRVVATDRGDHWADSITTREVEVLRLVARGLPNHETARRLSTSEPTVARYIHVFESLEEQRNFEV